jgi:hypothetical protein
MIFKRTLFYVLSFLMEKALIACLKRPMLTLLADSGPLGIPVSFNLNSRLAQDLELNNSVQTLLIH